MTSPERAQRVRPRALTLALIVAVAATPTVIVVAGSNTVDAGSFLTDTSDGLVFRVAMELLFDGRSPYDTALHAEHIAGTRLAGAAPPYTLPFAYPPNALPLFALYAIGRPAPAYACFAIGGMVSLLVASWMLMTHLRCAPADRVLSVLAVGCFGAGLFNARLGQTGAWLTLTIVLYAALYDTRPRLAAIALGLMAFKPQYALFMGVLPLVRRQWAVLGLALTTFAACSVTSGVWFGFERWPEFFTAATAPNHTIVDMSNWFGLLQPLWPGPIERLQPLGLPMMILGAAWFGWIAYHRDDDSNVQVLAGGLAMALLFSPNTHPYDLLAWVLPIGVLCRRIHRCSSWMALAVVGTLFVFTPRWLLAVVSLILAVLCLRTRESVAAPRAPAKALLPT